MKKTQVQTVKEILHETGEISRNTCLKMYISRLSAIIQILEDKGYTFSTSHRAGDYVYTLVSEPKKPTPTFKEENGMRVFAGFI